MREQEWQKRFEEQKRSELSVAAWCKREGIAANKFHYWRQRLSERNEAGEPGRFMKLGGVEPVELHIGERLRIRVPANFEAASLKRLLEVLGC